MQPGSQREKERDKVSSGKKLISFPRMKQTTSERFCLFCVFHSVSIHIQNLSCRNCTWMPCGWNVLEFIAFVCRRKALSPHRVHWRYYVPWKKEINLWKKGAREIKDKFGCEKSKCGRKRNFLFGQRLCYVRMDGSILRLWRMDKKTLSWNDAWTEGCSAVMMN